MHKFYFNECLSANISIEFFAQYLSDTIKEYDKIAKNNTLRIEKAIVTEKIPSEMSVCGINLKSAILAIQEREVRNLAFTYFTKYPIADSFDIEVEHLLQANYKFGVLDALNLAIVALNAGFTFSVAVDKVLKCNMLVVNGDGGFLNVYNLYGESSNTNYIESYIQNLNLLNEDKYKQLKIELGDSVISNGFERVFLSENAEVQTSIIDAFKNARKRNLVTPYYPDTKLIKDVTPNTSKKANVYELRVYTPIALRVYFYESESKVFLAKIGYKADYKENTPSQSQDIARVHNMLHKMVVTPNS